MRSFYIILYLLFLSCSATRSHVSVLNESLLVVNDTVHSSINEHYFGTTLERKLDGIANVLSQVGSSVKHMQEQTHSWSIFHHHINAWNAQMIALEHKIELIQRTQDAHHNYGNQLTSLELTLNHVLSKVVYLSDRDCSCKGQGLWPPAELLRSADRQPFPEILTRLTNILQRFEKFQCGNSAGSRVNAKGIPKAERLMRPVGGCNATQRHSYNMEQSVKAMQQQLSSLAASLPLKDFKQLFAVTRKSSRSLEDITRSVRQTEVGLVKWRESEVNQTRSLHEFCQGVSGELSTFTESSDHLLKRIESVVSDLNGRLNNFSCEARAKDNGSSSINEGEKSFDEEFSKPDSEFDGEIDCSTASVEGADVDDDDLDMDHRETHPQTDEIDFKQPSKSACDELKERVDGVYKFSAPEYNEAGRDFNERLCVFATNGAAWTVIQNRGPYGEGQQENFNRSWAEYRDGFGQLSKEFWFGNEFVHKLVYRDDYEMRIELQDFEDVRVWVEYSLFRLESERYNYNLLIGGYRGAVPDAMQYHNEVDFSTYDRRNDRTVDACCACATGYASGWWFDNCSEANLNGVYRETPRGHTYVGVIWEPWRGDYSVMRARILIRPKAYQEEEVVSAGSNENTEDP